MIYHTIKHEKMSLLYQIITEYIDDIIKKKKRQVKSLESIFDVVRNSEISKKLNNLRREINYLQVAKYKMNEYFVFIQEIEK